MSVQPVRKGEALTAQAWNNLAATVNSITSGSTLQQGPKTIQCTILNHTSDNYKAGTILTIYKAGTTRISSLSPEEARRAWMQNGFQLDGYASGTNGVPALLLEGVEAGKIARCTVSGICAGYVTTSSSTVPNLVQYANNGTFSAPSASSGQTADWRVIAASTVAGGKAFCYLTPVAVAGSSGSTSMIFITGDGTSSFSANTIIGDNTDITIGQVYTAGGTRAVIKGAQYSLSAPSMVVTDIYCDQDGNLIINTAPLALTKSFNWS